jgi:Rrf2 family protein
MELSLGRRADYAIRATLALARHHDARLKSRQIAEEMAIPAGYLAQIMALLVRAGIVASVAGPNGGYSLARPPVTVNLLEVVEAVDGASRSSECVLRGGPCRWDDVCAVHVPWARAQQALLAQLATTSFAEIAVLDQQIEEGRFRLPGDLRAVAPLPAPAAEPEVS